MTAPGSLDWGSIFAYILEDFQTGLVPGEVAEWLKAAVC